MVNHENRGGILGGRFDLFHSLDKEKKIRIINTAMEEFAEKGFKRASTNEIVQRAGISKGMLFYYFGSKEELFDFLCEYTLEFANAEYLKKSFCETGDFLERCIKLTEIKRKVMSDFPVVIKFLESLYLPENGEYFKKHMENAEKLHSGVLKNIYGDLDYSLFRDDINPQKVALYIKWLVNSYEDDITARIKNGTFRVEDETALADEWEHFYEFVEDLRKIFYKNN